MKKGFLTVVMWAAVMLFLTACAMETGKGGVDASGVVMPAPVDFPSSVAARPGLSQRLEEWQKITGIVKEVSDDLVLVDLAQDGGKYMLRFTEDTAWNEYTGTAICTGNTMTCIVLPEETFVPPAQGEVLEVLSNTAG